MRVSRTVLIAVAALGLLAGGVSAAGAAPRADDPAEPAAAVGELVDASGDTVGDAFAFEEGSETFWMLSVHDLDPGVHGVQLHTVGDCGNDLEDVGDQVAGADLATLSVLPDGSGDAIFLTSSDDLAGLDDVDGFSLVVHDLPDNRANVPARYQSTDSSSTGADVTTQETGDAGAGIGCAVMDTSDAFGTDDLQRTRATFARRAAAHAAGPAARAAGPRAAPLDYLQADVVDASGGRHGRIVLAAGSQSTGAVATEVTGLAGGVHGVQIHDTGTCTGPNFSGAGPRTAGTDLPDVVASGATDSPGTFGVSTTELPALEDLVAGDGATVVVHTNPDNHANIPTRYTSTASTTGGPDATTLATGDTGVGVLCGVLRVVPPTERFIEGVYDSLLERPVEPSATGTWTRYLQRHSRSSFVGTVASTTEARRWIVTDLYQYHLGVDPDRSGLDYWTAQLGKPGFRQDALEASLIGSTRYFEDAGGTNRDYVETLYGFLLGRDASGNERAIWTTYLGRGGSRATMAASLLATDAYRADTIATEYLLRIDRDPSDAEVAIWLAYLRRRGDIRDVRRALLASDEFYAYATQGLVGFGPIGATTG